MKVSGSVILTLLTLFVDVAANIPLNNKPLEVEVVDIHPLGLNSDIYHIDLKHDGNFPYIEGQSLGVVPPGIAKDGKKHKQRMYSIASDSDDDIVSLCVRKVAKYDENNDLVGGTEGVCSTYLCTRQIGDRVPIAGPFGKAMLMPESDETPLVMVATGTGIAPFKGFLNSRKKKGVPSNAQLFLGVRTEEQMPYREEMEALAEADETFDLQLCVSRPEKGSLRKKEYVQDRLRSEAKKVLRKMDSEAAHLYMCGLKGMKEPIFEALKEEAAAQGRDWQKLYSQWKKEKRIHVEVY